MNLRSFRRNGHSARHVVSILALVGSLLTYRTQPAAAYDWCSVDPVFTLQRSGRLTAQTIDVQVLVPLSALPLTSAATLAVTVPPDVTSHEDLNTSTALFVLHTVMDTAATTRSTTTYPITLGLLVPATATSFPVRLLITDPGDGTVTTVDGVAGQELRTTVQIGQ